MKRRVLYDGNHGWFFLFPAVSALAEVKFNVPLISPLGRSVSPRDLTV